MKRLDVTSGPPVSGVYRRSEHDRLAFVRQSLLVIVIFVCVAGISHLLLTSHLLTTIGLKLPTASARITANVSASTIQKPRGSLVKQNTIDCSIIDGGRLGDCDQCHETVSNGVNGWYCDICKRVPLQRMDESGKESLTPEFVDGLVIVGGVCKACVEVISMASTRAADCESCAVDSGAIGFRCVAYSSREACERVGQHSCHRCKEKSPIGAFECLSCAEGMTLFDGRCQLKRKLKKRQQTNVFRDALHNDHQTVFDVGSLG